MGIFFAIFCAVTWSASVVLFKKAAEEIHPVLINLCKNWIGTLLMVPTVLIFSPFSFSAIANTDLAILVVSGILGIGLADALVLKSLNSIGASRIAIVECTYSPFVIFIAILHLGETLNMPQIAGIALVLSALLMISLSEKSAGGLKSGSREGIVLGVLGIFSMALGITIVKPIFDRVDLLPIVFIRLLAGSIASLLIVPALSIPVRQIRNLFTVKRKLPFFGACVLSTYISMLFWVAGFKFNDVSIASVLNQTSTIFTVIFAAVFLKEKLTQRVITAAGLAVAGVVMVTLYS
jgi:drug/metabolite transporter (DMT)-like permease